ncbi:hypothetical protein MFFC18_25990 [Mariniblastus fucicola]|uniref:Uncharacterized protein n=1 Tax=Mariniblastus fucicola TaxID=980251 RepID=A0A5B9PDR8_9BACT|nr:hypothetical protein MFFC18_25990 [Mariniblastus fucicola]
MQLTSRYLIAFTTLIAICLAIALVPHVGDQLWPFRFASLIIGISCVVHLVTSAFHIRSWTRWLFAALAPTLCLCGWYVFSVQFLNEHPGSIGVEGYLTGGLFWFPIGYLVVEVIMRTVCGAGQPDRKRQNAV